MCWGCFDVANQRERRCHIFARSSHKIERGRVARKTLMSNLPSASTPKRYRSGGGVRRRCKRQGAGTASPAGVRRTYTLCQHWIFFLSRKILRSDWWTVWTRVLHCTRFVGLFGMRYVGCCVAAALRPISIVASSCFFVTFGCRGLFTAPFPSTPPSWC